MCFWAAVDRLPIGCRSAADRRVFVRARGRHPARSIVSSMKRWFAPGPVYRTASDL